MRLSVQRNEHTTEDDWRSIQRSCRGRVRSIEAHRSITRANLVLSEPVIHQGRLAGCGGRRHTDYLHIGFDGAVFLCEEDYRKNYAFGNLLSQSLDDVLGSPQRLEYIGFINGEAPAPEGFLGHSRAYARVAGNTSLVQRIADALNARLVRRAPLKQVIRRR